MATLSDPGVPARCCERISRLDPGATARWGRMNARQMVCHLTDAFRLASGEKEARLASNILQRTLVKWIALRSPMRWPPGVPTRPEIEQGRGGTPPAAWERDCADLQALIFAFAERTEFGVHPVFGKMSRRDWMSWGYRHVDHHLRQFGA